MVVTLHAGDVVGDGWVISCGVAEITWTEG